MIISHKPQWEHIVSHSYLKVIHHFELLSLHISQCVRHQQLPDWWVTSHFVSCSRCLSEACWWTWWASALSVTPTPTAAKAARHTTTATRTTATPTVSTATEVTATLMEDMGRATVDTGTAAMDTDTPTARGVEAWMLTWEVRAQRTVQK